MSEETVPVKENRSIFLSVTLCESILAILLILSLIFSKYFFKKPYRQIKKWYTENIMIDIDIEELIKEAKDEV